VSDDFQWSYRIPFSSSDFINQVWFRAIFTNGAFLVLTLLAFLMGGGNSWSLLVMVLVLFLAYVGILLLIIGRMLYRLGGGIDVRYYLTPEGVGYLNHMPGLSSLQTGLFLLTWGLAGDQYRNSVLYGIFRQSDFYSWSSMAAIKVNPGERSIRVHSGDDRVRDPMFLYCSEENFPIVLDAIKWKAEAGAVRE